MSTAEQRVSSGFPVGNPSGVNPSLTPSTEQVAQAKSLAGGKVRVLGFLGCWSSKRAASDRTLPQGGWALRRQLGYRSYYS
jgi:hypothetical protein